MLRALLLTAVFITEVSIARADPFGQIEYYAGDVRLQASIISYSEAKYLTTIRQEHDFSCGSAAVATLLSYHYEHATSEVEAFKSMYNNGDKEVIRKAGFSLLDIKRFLAEKGFASDGFRLPLETLKKIGVPAIVLINEDGYKHFIVIKGLDDTHVFVGDPAKGTRYVPREEFMSMWNGIVFLIRNKKDIGERHFGVDDPYGIIARAPLDSVIYRDGYAMNRGLPFGQMEF